MELHDKVRQLKASWSSCHGQEPSSEDLRLALQLSLEQWQELLSGQAMARPLDLETGYEETRLQGDEGGMLWESESTGADDWEHQVAEVRQQLACLEPGLRRVIQKVVLSGWSYRRTAALLQVSPITVQRRLKQGLAKLRSALLIADALSTLSCQPRSHPAPSVAPTC